MTRAESLATQGWVFDIQGYSLQDGPGIRTTVFAKGCPLRCWWCSNPESQSTRPQVLHASALCARCGRCIEACADQAIRRLEDGSVETDQSVCSGCGTCLEACRTGARSLKGRLKTVGEVVKRVAQDSLFYRNSGGGVTVSGGEPLMQPVFTRELCRQVKEEGIHTALDTTGYAPWEVLEPIAENVDLFLYDIKNMGRERHSRYTGVDNAVILENARRLAGIGKALVIRVPLVPGVNDGEENLRATAELAVELGGVEVDLLPYHRFGLSKYLALGREYPMGDRPGCQESEIEEAIKTIAGYGIRVTVA